MADFKAMLSNKWVWGGGLALGLVLMLVAGRGGGSTATSSPDNGAGIALQLASIQAGNNRSAMEYAASRAATEADLTKVSIAAQVQRDLAVVDYVRSAGHDIAVLLSHENEVSAGIQNARIQSATALQLDQQQGFVRLNQTWVEGNTALALKTADNALTQSLAWGADDVTKTGIASNERIAIRGMLTSQQMQDSLASSRERLAGITGVTAVGIAHEQGMSAIRTAEITGEVAKTQSWNKMISDAITGTVKLVGMFI